MRMTDETNTPSRRSVLLSLVGLVGGLVTGCGLAPSEAHEGGGAEAQSGREDNSKDKRKAMTTAANSGAAPAAVQTPPGREVATLGAGCFWCVEAIFLELKGVDKVVSGYAGGDVPNPTYEAVCTGTTGHAEVVQITFDPKVIAFADILRVFFTTHDPTTLNQQGADVGTQYRSAIFYHSAAQKAAAEQVMKQVREERIWRNRIVTEVTPYRNFYAAEAYHQNYYAQNQNAGYCRVVIEPKVRKFREKYRALLKK
jgi:peptide-methionine (S)-S-oxide reductase